MYKLKSAIVLKNKIYITNHDNYTKMLEELDIADNHANAENMFVKVELYPRNDDMFSNIEGWTMNVDQDIRPDWFFEEVEKPKLVQAVKEWAEEHIFIGKNKLIFECKEDTALYFKDCKNVMVRILGNATAVVNTYDSSTTKVYVYDSATAVVNTYNSTITEVYSNNSATAKVNTYDISDTKIINEDSATAVVNTYNSTITEVYSYGTSTTEISTKGSSKAKIITNDSSTTKVNIKESSTAEVITNDSATTEIINEDNSTPEIIMNDGTTAEF